MSPLSMTRSALGLLTGLLLATSLPAAEISVMNSGGFSAAYKRLLPSYEKASGDTLKTAWGPSMGTTQNAIPVRLARGEKADVVIMVGYALDDLIEKGLVEPDSKVDLANSPIAVAVKAGAPKPDIHDVAALKQTLLDVKTVAYSDSASGEYISKQMFARLGIAEQMKGKARKVPATPVGEIVARGDAELGFQQKSELLPVQGIEVIGELPADVQKMTVFSAGIVKGAAHPQEARELIHYLASQDAAPVLRETGLDPLTP